MGNVPTKIYQNSNLSSIYTFSLIIKIARSPRGIVPARNHKKNLKIINNLNLRNLIRPPKKDYKVVHRISLKLKNN